VQVRETPVPFFNPNPAWKPYSVTTVDEGEGAHRVGLENVRSVTSITRDEWDKVEVKRKHVHPLSEAWVTGKLDDLPAAEAGLVYGRAEIESLRARGLLDITKERWFFRYGPPPASGRSRNFTTGDLEAGVSSYWTPAPSSMAGLSYVGKKPLYAMRGTWVEYGSDDEPLVKMRTHEKATATLLRKWGVADTE